MNMNERIRTLRLEKGMTQEELGKYIGVQKSAIRKYESGAVENIKRSSIQKLAEVFGVSPSYLMGWEDTKEDEHFIFENIHPIEIKKFPLLGEVACGEPKLAVECFEGYIEVGADIQADFCLKAKGDSMINARIHDGDIVFVRKQSIVNDGEIGVVIIDNEATLKRIYMQDGVISLVAENPKYQPIIYTGEKLNEVRILGKAIAFQSDIK